MTWTGPFHKGPYTVGEGVVNLELEFERTVISCLDPKIRDVQGQEQTLELRLPDGMPDIGTVLGAWGQCILRGKEWRSSEIGVSGGVMVWVLYQPADGSGPQSVEAWLPMQQKWNLVDSQREGVIRTRWQLQNVDARTLSVRKLMIRAAVQVLAEVLEPMEAQISLPTDVPADIQLLRREYPAQILREAGEKTFQLEDVLALPSGAVMPEKLLYCQVMPILAEQKVVGGRAVFRGSVRCHTLYRGVDGELHSADPELSFGQFEDLERSYDEGATLSVMMEVTGFEPEVQDGQLRAKCGLSAQYGVQDRVMVDMVEDAYSPIRNVTVNIQPQLLPTVLDSSKKIMQPEAEYVGGRIVDAVLYPEHPTLHRAGDLTEMDFPGIMQILAYNDEGRLEGTQLRWNEHWELPIDSGAQVNPQVISVTAPQVSGGRITAELETQADTVASSIGPAVTSMEIGEPSTPDPNRPSLILRRIGENSLWDLAKKTGSTVDAIYAANRLTQEPTADRILLIPIP